MSFREAPSTRFPIRQYRAGVDDVSRKIYRSACVYVCMYVCACVACVRACVCLWTGISSKIRVTNTQCLYIPSRCADRFGWMNDDHHWSGAIGVSLRSGYRVLAFAHTFDRIHCQIIYNEFAPFAASECSVIASRGVKLKREKEWGTRKCHENICGNVDVFTIFHIYFGNRICEDLENYRSAIRYYIIWFVLLKKLYRFNRYLCIYLLI